MKVLLYRLIQITWGFPQTLMGFILCLKNIDAPHYSYRGSIVTRWNNGGGISLGMFIFVENKKEREEYVQRHEYGHTIQSLVLGPLYLLVIGIPSFVWANLKPFVTYRERTHVAYQSFIVEHLADVLGGNHMRRIGIANDHSAPELKFKVMDHLQRNGYTVINYGTDSDESVDYPIYGEKLAMGIKNGECDLGIAICGTGVGISIAANKVKGIRAGVCSEPKTAALIVEHNNAQILAFGARIVDEKTAFELVDTFLNAKHDTDNPRHDRRIGELQEIEERQ